MFIHVHVLSDAVIHRSANATGRRDNGDQQQPSSCKNNTARHVLSLETVSLLLRQSASVMTN